MNFRIKECETDLNTLDIFSLWKDETDTILLDSSKEESASSRYSFIGINSFLKFTSKSHKSFIQEEEVFGEPFDVLNTLIQTYSFDFKSNIPLLSGALGYISYDTGRILEEIPSLALEDFPIDDMYFLFFDNIIIIDLLAQKKYITGLGILEDSETSIEKINQRIRNALPSKEEKSLKKSSHFVSTCEKNEYMSMVDSVKDYIREGHTYIANISQRFSCESLEDSYDIYKELRRVNPAPFSAFLHLEDMDILSSSPERFLHIIERKIETRPIKGTMPRGKNDVEDAFYRNALLQSEKDKSELLMITDLERNDLSKVCKRNTVKVTELFKLEEYATVFHLVATIEGILESGKSSVDCIKECFPGGSITGAPKIRTMEIIEELEKVRRGVYTGAIGYFDLRGNCDFNIAIRTIVKKEGTAYFAVGAGITIESDSEKEYVETLDKAKALMSVL